MMLSISARSPWLRVRSGAPRLSSRWAGVRESAMATCTAGWASTQATASWAVVAPRSAVELPGAATTSRLRRIPGPVKPGLCDRQSSPNCQVPYAIGSPSAGWPPVSPSAFRSPCRLACLIPGQPRARLGEPASHVLVIQTHMRHLYQKLGARRRSEAVEQARALGLLASSARRPWVAGRLRRAWSQDSEGNTGERSPRLAPPATPDLADGFADNGSGLAGPGAGPAFCPRACEQTEPMTVAVSGQA